MIVTKDGLNFEGETSLGKIVKEKMELLKNYC